MLTSTLPKTLEPHHRYRSRCGRRSGYFWLPSACKQASELNEFWIFCEEMREDTSSHVSYSREDAESSLRTWVDEGVKPAFSLTPLGRKRSITEFTERVRSFKGKLYTEDYLGVLAKELIDGIQDGVNEAYEDGYDPQLYDLKRSMHDLIVKYTGSPV